jgi:hypothetical protein
MKIPFLPRAVDERFLEHRRRSSSVAGIAGGVLAILLFEWHLLVDHRFSGDLLAVALTFAVVKMTLFFWYRHKD